MKVLVIGGMHGNEPLGPEVVRLLREQKDGAVDTLLANELALQANARFVGADLNRSFPGDIASGEYESRRAAEVLRACEGYDVVLDFHNTHCQGNDCSFVGDTAGQLLFDASAWFGLKRIVVADYDCLNKYAPNCISIEISLSSERMSAKVWARAITELAALSALPKAEGLELYRFVYRMTLEDKDRLGLGEKDLRAFQPLEPGLASEMGMTATSYPIFVADQYTPYNFGGLLNRMDV